MDQTPQQIPPQQPVEPQAPSVQPEAPQEPPMMEQPPVEKSSNMVILLIILGVVLIGGYVFIAYTQNWLPFTSAPEAGELSTTEAHRDEIHCGSLRDEYGTFLMFEFPMSSPATQAEKDALNCFNDAILSCSPANLVLVDGEEAVTARVIGRNDGECIISAQNFDLDTTVCSLTDSLIEEGHQNAIAQGVEEALSFGIILTISLQTGNTTPTPGLDCSLPKPAVSFKIELNGEQLEIDGPVTVPDIVDEFTLFYETNLYAKSCKASGAWEGSKNNLGGAFTFFRGADRYPPVSLKRSFENSDFIASGDNPNEYIFKLTCSNKSGDTSEEIIIRIEE
jgi:hypothetical protein